MEQLALLSLFKGTQIAERCLEALKEIDESHIPKNGVYRYMQLTPEEKKSLAEAIRIVAEGHTGRKVRFSMCIYQVHSRHT